MSTMNNTNSKPTMKKQPEPCLTIVRETYLGFEIKENEYGSFNVPAINCWCTSKMQYAKDAIDRHLERERVKQMAAQMYESACDAFAADDMPPAMATFEFCRDCECNEPGTYPLFRDVELGVRLAAEMAYEAKAAARQY